MSDGLRKLAEGALANPRTIDDARVKGVSLGMADYLTISPTQLLGLLDRLEAAEGAVARVRALADEPDLVSQNDVDWFEAVELGDLREALDGPEAAVEGPVSDPGASDDQLRHRQSGEAASEGER